MPATLELPQQIPAPRAKAGMQKPQGGGKFLVQIPEGAREGDGYGKNRQLHNFSLLHVLCSVFKYQLYTRIPRIALSQ